MLSKIKQDLKNLANPKQAKLLQGFFKTGKGQYGEGDIFLGIKVPEQRKVAKKYSELTLTSLTKLLKSKIHEERLVALLILTAKYQKAAKDNNEKEQTKLVNCYLSNTKYINNWDLVDLTAHKILGHYLLKRNRKVLYELAKSSSLWEKRISVIATFEFIRNKQYDDNIKIAEILLNDTHDLIHKAVGWMLREIGKKDQAVEERFLKKHYKTMPRTMLRYAIERFSDKKRKFYMKK
jgi:3-methyladenine DNA glycosylase AlkD